MGRFLGKDPPSIRRKLAAPHWPRWLQPVAQRARTCPEFTNLEGTPKFQPFKGKASSLPLACISSSRISSFGKEGSPGRGEAGAGEAGTRPTRHRNRPGPRHPPAEARAAQESEGDPLQLKA